MGILGGRPGTCAGSRKDGSPCRSPQTLTDSKYCFAHDPTSKSIMMAGRKKGGLNRSDTVRLVAKQQKIETIRIRSSLPDYLADVNKMLYEMVKQVIDGEVSQGVALTVSTIAGRLVDLARFDLEIGEAQKAMLALARITKNQNERERAG